MRQITEFTARVMPFSGSGDSAAAMVTISVPMKENIVTSMAEMIAVYPFGRKPSGSQRWLTPLVSEPGNKPRIATTPIAMNAMMATTLIKANQNSNSP